MLPKEDIRRVAETVSQIANISVGRLIEGIDCDLSEHFGLDPTLLHEVSAALEKQFFLEAGALGAFTDSTIGTLVAGLALARSRSGCGVESLVLEKNDIETLIPHRPPILMLERVIELRPGRSGVGIKQLLRDDVCFAGHFPGRPILPGVLVVEACAQLTAVVCFAGAANRRLPSLAHAGILEYLASIERFKFLRPVRPGDTLILRADIRRLAGDLLQSKVGATVGKRPVAEGALVVTNRSA